jgi:single-stranded-DNA-specific exonuclease
MQNEWRLRRIDNPDAVRRMQRELNDIPEALARALVLRGIDSYDRARNFFRPDRENLHDPFLMQDMDRAADRVTRAVDRDEKILVYGDYDVDGTTATALMMRFLDNQGAEASYFIPDRYRDGYGLSRRGIDEALDRGADLIVALDCGITAHDMAQYVREQGVDLIICDHHTPGESIPEAVAVLDPKRPDCSYPFKELSGCGVGFKLAQAVLSRGGRDPEGAFRYLDLLALSIASDIVPIGGENRILMRESLKIIREHPSPGVRALARRSDVDLETCTTSSIVFRLGPRINAAGRMDSAEKAVALMLARDRDEVDRLAADLDSLNRQRRSIDRQIREEATEQAREYMAGGENNALVLFGEDWHLGVIGIVASRVVEQFYRPTVMLCEVDGAVKGSARSVTGFNIYNALSECRELLSRFGGHDYAAGMTLEKSDLPAFRDRLNRVVGETITTDQLVPKVDIDAPLDLEEITPRFWSVLSQFQPFGPANQRPVFLGEGLEVDGYPRIVGSGNLKFKVRQAGRTNGRVFPVIGFDMEEYLPLVKASAEDGERFDLAFSLEENHWNGNRELQLKAKDLRATESLKV